MTTFKLDDHEIFYQEYGRAEDPAVVLLHHGLGSTYSWKEQNDPLVEAGFRVVAYDRWGYGRSSSRDSLDLPHFEQDQKDLMGLMDSLGLDRPVLVGHSDGGTLALYFAAAHPGRVRALAVIAAHIYVEERMQESIHEVWKSYTDRTRLREGLRRLHGEKVDQTFYNWFNGWVGPENSRWDMRPLLGAICCPALVIQGTEDEHATTSHAEETAAGIPGAELLIVPGGGHMLPQEQADFINVQLLSFLSKTKDGARN